MITETTDLSLIDAPSALSWKAIFAGSTATLAITLILLAFGVGVGFSVVSPWSGSGVSGTTFTIAAGLYFIVVAMLSSTIGGYIAGRLRSQWTTVHMHERYFRDTAHGFLVWAFATIIGVVVLGGAATHILSGVGAGLAPAATTAASDSPTDVYVDTLLRADPAAALSAGPASGQSNNGIRGAITRIVVPSFRKGGTLSAADRIYIAKVVSTRTGLSQPEAEKRVDQVVTEARASVDTARKSAAKFSLWLVVSMLAGALSASLAAVEGGRLRNSEWYLTAN